MWPQQLQSTATSSTTSHPESRPWSPPTYRPIPTLLGAIRSQTSRSPGAMDAPPPQGPEASGISNRVFVALCPLCPWPLPPPSSAEGLVVPPPTSPCPGKMRSTFGVSPGIALGWDFTPKLGAKARPAGVGPEQGHRTAAGSRAHLHLFPAPHPSCD